jgi:hypothetical protein
MVYVCVYLLSKTYTGSCVERTEDEGVRDQIFLYSFIQEPIRIKYECWKSKVNRSTNHEFEPICDHTVRAPQVCSTMHDENTIDTATTISVSKQINMGLRREIKRANSVCAGM